MSSLIMILLAVIGLLCVILFIAIENYRWKIYTLNSNHYLELQQTSSSMYSLGWTEGNKGTTNSMNAYLLDTTQVLHMPS